MSWDIVSLKDICQTTQGIQIPKYETKSTLFDGGYRYLYIQDFLSDNSPSYVIDGYEHKKVTEFDLVMANTGSPGSVFKGKNGILSNNLFRISFDGEVLDRDFFYLYLSSVAFQQVLQSQMKGGIQKHLGHKTIGQQKIPLPPLPEQKRIASILDATDALRTKRRQAIAMLDELLQATFLDMFGDPVVNEKGWEVARLIDISKSKPEYGSGASACDYHEGMPRYIRITDIKDNGSLEHEKKSANLDDKDNNKYQLNDQDLLFARSGATVGKTYIHKDENGFCVFAGYLIRFIIDTNIALPIFVFRYTKTKAYADWVGLQARAVAQPNINAKMYSDLELPIPPLTLQTQFANIVEKVEAQKAVQQAHLAELDTLFASLQQRAFAGDL